MAAYDVACTPDARRESVSFTLTESLIPTGCCLSEAAFVQSERRETRHTFGVGPRRASQHKDCSCLPTTLMSAVGQGAVKAAAVVETESVSDRDSDSFAAWVVHNLLRSPVWTQEEK
eukprot:6485866-Amphidinium_carterae.1